MSISLIFNDFFRKRMGYQAVDYVIRLQYGTSGLDFKTFCRIVEENLQENINVISCNANITLKSERQINYI